MMALALNNLDTNSKEMEEVVRCDGMHKGSPQT